MLASHKGEIPFVVFIVPFLAGIVLALTFNLAGFQIALIISFFTLLTGFIVLNLLYQQATLYRVKWIGGIIIHILLLLAGITCTLNYDSRNHYTYFTKHPADMLLVKVGSEPQFKNNMLRFTAAVEMAADKGTKRSVSGSLLITMRTDSAHARTINYDDELLIPAKYNAIDPPFNPAEFNYKQYLAHQNVYQQAFLNPQDVVVIDREAGNPIVAYSLQLRQRLVGQFRQYMHSQEAIAVASTLILGYKAELDNDILQAYSKTGTIHVLSVSGAHVAIIFVMIGWLLGFMDRWKHGRVFKAVLTIVLIWYYSLLTGLSPAVCRAAVMISMVIIGKTYNRQINMLNILAVSAFSILMFDPFLITDVGFQLSYLAVAGLVVFQPIVYNLWDIENKWLDKLWVFCSASIAIQAITFPLSAYYFHQFPVYFLLSNLFIIIPVEVIMYAGIICLGVAQMGIPALAKFAGYVLEKSILLMDKGLQIVERSPYASVGKIWINRGEYVLLFAVMVLLFCLIYYKRPVFIKVALALVLVLSISLSLKRTDGIKSNTITFFNLKKHPAILFKQGTSAVLLTDLADTDKVYRYSIQPCLDSTRVNDLTIIPFNKDTVTSFLAKRGKLIRFLNKDVLIVDQTSRNRFYQPITADYLFVTGSPHTDMDNMSNSYQYQTLIADAGNTDRFLAALKAGWNKNDRKMYVLKRNKSFIIQSD
ncbi:MAG: ComEC/Rec2 family competence protein [Bacteroidota bacterium]